MALERRILARRPPGSTAVASMRDFVLLGSPELVRLSDAFYAAPEAISPYAIDFTRGEVVFVRAAGVDLAEAHPFFYEAQRRSATSAITASFDEVDALADDLAGISMRFTFLYSAGRSGSTIAGQIAAGLPGVQALSEPDVFAHIATHRVPRDGEREALLVRVTRSVSRMLAAHCAAVDPTRRQLLVKQRGMGIFGAEIVHAAVPTARAVFLSRKPADVVDSYVGTFLRNPVVAFGRHIGLDRFAVRVLRRFIRFVHPWIPRFMPNVVAESATTGPSDGAVEVLALSVQAMNDEATRLASCGAVQFSRELRYEELKQNPLGFARGLAEGMGLGETRGLDALLENALSATDSDSQRGTALASRGVRALSEDDVARVARALAIHGREVGANGGHTLSSTGAA
jgi:hypothetical protein